MSEDCALVKPFPASMYGCAAEKTLQASPHVTSSISVQPAQDNIANLRFLGISLPLLYKGNTAQLRLRASADLFRQFCGLKSEKYIQYSFTFQTLT